MARKSRSESDRRVRQANRLSQVLKLLELLQGNGRWDAASLAVELECSERTIYRHLDVLDFAGVPFWFDREERRYRVRPDFRFPVLNLNEDELLGQAVATEITSSRGLDVSAGAGPTTMKLSASSGSTSRQVLEQAAELVKVLDLKLVDHSDHREIIHLIQQALFDAKQISGSYSSPYDPRSKRLRLHPIRLCLVRQAWYLIAKPDDEDSPKTYRATRFDSVKVLDAEADRPADFDLQAYFGNAWSVFRGGETYDIELRFSKDAAVQATETQWHHTQQVERHQDGSVTLSFQIDGLDEIIWWLLGWTGFVEVIKPEQLRRSLVEQLQEGLRLNSKRKPE